MKGFLATTFSILSFLCFAKVDPWLGLAFLCWGLSDFFSDAEDDEISAKQAESETQQQAVSTSKGEEK